MNCKALFQPFIDSAVQRRLIKLLEFRKDLGSQKAVDIPFRKQRIFQILHSIPSSYSFTPPAVMPPMIYF